MKTPPSPGTVGSSAWPPRLRPRVHPNGRGHRGVYTPAMVRPDELLKTHVSTRGPGCSRCIEPAGASPAPVGVGAPGSRPQVWGEIPRARAGCQEPLRREQVRGPQHEVGSVRNWRDPSQRPLSGQVRSYEAMPKSNGAEPLMSRRRRPLTSLIRSARQVPAGYGWWHVHRVRCGTGEIPLSGICQGKSVRMRRCRSRTVLSGSPRGS